MADQKIKKLARNLSQVKQIASDVNINTYYKEIKPFLFGNSSPKPIKRSDLPSVGGIYKIANTGVMSPSESPQVIIKVSGKTSKNYKIPNVTNSQFISDLQPDKDGNRKKRASEYFFPSDLVRVLTGLAKVFYNSKYNVDELTSFASGSSNHQDFVKKWGQVNTEPELLKIDVDYFYEEKIITYNSGNVKKLLDAVITAAIEFENTNEKADLNKFDPISEIRTKIIKEIVPQIFNKLIEDSPDLLKKHDSYEEIIKPVLEKKDDFIKDKSSDFKEDLYKDITTPITDNSLDFFRDLFKQSNLDIFEKEYGNYDPETKYFLFTTRETDGKNGIKQTDIYSDFIKESIKNFLEKNQEEFIKTYILPLFVNDDGTAVSSEEADTEGGGDTPDLVEEEVEIESPVSLEEFKTRLAENIIKEVSSIFLNDYVPDAFRSDDDEEIDKDRDFSEYKNRIEEHYIQPVNDEIKTRIDNNILADFVIEDSERTELVNQKLFAEDVFEQKVFETDWYKELLSQNVEYVQNAPYQNPNYQSFFEYLYKEFIAPPILLLQEETAEQAETEEDIAAADDVDQTGQEATGANVPRHIQGLPTENVTVSQGQINRLTPEERRTLQYESAWMYNRAVYELFTSKGIKQGDIDPNVLLNLQSNIFNYTASMEEGDFNKLFGSSSFRQKALLNFYQKSGYGINKFQNAQELLGATLKTTLNLDSPVLTENIKNTVDSLIIQYGLNQDVYAFDKDTQQVTQFSGTNTHDIIWFIENVPSDRLAIIFNLPSGLIADNEEIISILKESLKSYAKYRASELSLHIQSTSLQNGLSQISEEDALKIKAGDTETITKHLSFTNYLRDASKENGGETLAGAIDHKKNGDKQEIQKRFKTFIPLWDQLDGWERAHVYEQFGIPVPPEYLTAGELDRHKLGTSNLGFITEFIFFDVTKLGDIRELAKRHNLNEQKQAEIMEIAAIQSEIVRERKLAELLNKGFDQLTDESEYQEIGELVGVDYNDSSFRERMIADEAIQAGGKDSYEVQEVRPGRGGAIPRILDSKSGKGLKKLFGRDRKKKHDPKEKGKQALKNISGKGIDKVAAASLNLLPGIGTALSAALLAIKNKKLRNAISSIITLGLGALIAKTFHALGSIGGAIGGLIGGAVGYVTSGGAMVVPGLVVGANIGELILPQRWWGAWNNNKRAASPYAQPTRRGRTPSNAEQTSKPTLTKLVASYEGLSLIAVGGYSLMIVVMTLFVVLIIQSAFIIPIPQDRGSGNFGDGTVGELGPNGFECFIFGKANEQVFTELGDEFISKTWLPEEKEKIYQAYARKAGRNACFSSFTCDNGPITIYRASGRQYGGWAPSQLGGDVLIMYDLPFMDASGTQYVGINGLEYTFIHEIGHVIDYKKTNDFLNRFMQVWDQGNSCLTYPYPGSCNAGEAFAEAITLFVNHENYAYHTIEGVSLGTDENLPGSDKRIKRLYDFPNEAPAEYEWIKENVFCDEAITEQDESYLAIGPLTQSNIVASTDSELQNAQLTCSWAGGKNLDAAINANFYNTDEDGSFTPVGLAGYCPGNTCTLPVRYYEDSTRPSFNQYLKALAINNSGSPQIINGIPDMQSASTSLSMAVTGSYSDVQNAPDSSDKRTIIGTGVANSECSTQYANGQQMLFMGVFPNSTYAAAEQRLRECGATNLIHLDGGSSSHFCSSEGSFNQNKAVSVNLGLRNAEIIIGKESDAPDL